MIELVGKWIDRGLVTRIEGMTIIVLWTAHEKGWTYLSDYGLVYQPAELEHGSDGSLKPSGPLR